MNLDQRIHAFTTLGTDLRSFAQHPESNELFYNALRKSYQQNPWFTIKNSIIAIQSIAAMLHKQILEEWLSSYTIPNNVEPKTVAVVMAGNIPLVGFHDALCILLTGNKLEAKLSSKDSVLMDFVLTRLQQIEPEFSNNITIQHALLQNFDAIISTGSDNSARYFEYYFKKYPHIIRKNRNSIAVIIGDETEEELQALAKDIFQYFGLGCRNVSKIYIPEDFNITRVIDACNDYSEVFEHNKFMNNYEYNKSIYLVTRQEHLDNGFVLFKEDSQMSSPLAVVFYEKYTNFADVQTYVESMREKIQCIVCKENKFYKQNVPLGYAQSPNIEEYADDIDTISFLLQL